MQTRKLNIVPLIVLFAIAACSGPRPGNRAIKVNIEVTHRGSVVCPVPSGITSLPLEAHVGATIALEGFATSNDAVSYAWSGTGGTFSTPRVRKTSFTCAYAGDHPLTFTVKKAGCTDSSMRAIVTCTATSTGGIAGMGSNAGSGG